MGRGIALQARLKYPGIDFELGKFIMADRAAGRESNRVRLLSHNIIAFPTKHDWRKPADLKLIEKSARELIELIDKLAYWFREQHGYFPAPPSTILLPPLGCGNGWLKWSQVEPIVAPILVDNRFKVVFPPEGYSKIY